jgi:hypothetical protein
MFKNLLRHIGSGAADIIQGVLQDHTQGRLARRGRKPRAARAPRAPRAPRAYSRHYTPRAYRTTVVYVYGGNVNL